MWERLKLYLKILRSCFPSPLPIGMEAFDLFSDDILNTFNLPKYDSYKHAIATMIMHLGPTTAYKSKAYFALSLKKTMANQIAYAKIQEIRMAEEAKDALTKQEATPKEEPILVENPTQSLQ